MQINVNSENFVNNIENIAKYLGRYLARPAIADYRIVSFNHDFVKFWFYTPDFAIKRIFESVQAEKIYWKD